VQQNLYLLRLLGIEPDIAERPEFIVEEEDREAAARMLAGVGIEEDVRPIAVHVGSAQTILAQAKRWPAQQYADLIRQLRDRYGDRVVLLEGPDEAGVANEVSAHHPEGALKIVRLSGPLGHAAALLERAEFYVGTDSGLAHLAAAVGTPPVTLFAPADPDRVCPYGYRNLVVQPRKDCCPCFLYPWESSRPKMRCRAPMCITEIKREDVLAAVERAAEMRAVAVAYG
jgi:ADP-heptose:LPS heptosyltransferase